MHGIIGSGFGLYGHLPALAQLSNDPVMMPEKYFSKFKSRAELSVFEKKIKWADEEEILKEADSITFSISPKGQEEYIEKCINNNNIHSFVLEKPLSVDPQRSKMLLHKLINSNKKFRINYSFINTNWYYKIDEIINNNKIVSIELTWNFLAHHYRNNLNNWKRSNADGGGIIRFFGIHILAILCSLKFDHVISSTTNGFTANDLFKWEATFENSNKDPFSISIDSYNEKEEFSVLLKYINEAGVTKNYFLNMKDPFSEADVNTGQDARVENLKGLYSSFNKADDKYYKLYTATNNLWAEIEAATINKLKEQTTA